MESIVGTTWKCPKVRRHRRLNARRAKRNLSAKIARETFACQLRSAILELRIFLFRFRSFLRTTRFHLQMQQWERSEKCAKRDLKGPWKSKRCDYCVDVSQLVLFENSSRISALRISIEGKILNKRDNNNNDNNISYIFVIIYIFVEV